MSLDPAVDAEDRYAEACRRAEMVRSAWVKEGSPFVKTYPNKTVGQHVLFKMLMQAERHAELMSRALPQQRRHRGPDPVAVVGPLRLVHDDDVSPSEKLRRSGKARGGDRAS